MRTVELLRVPAAADSDTATKQTVDLMCRFIRESSIDPVVQDAANYIRQRMAGGDSPAQLAWGVFWFAKHNCKFVVDEAPLMRFERIAPGSGLGQQDMLISPAVLLRMDPWERKGDCDDFTMLCCALLKALGVPFVIVTIAADPSDPSRWSHVFCMALCPNAIPVDASHGSGPGWMVPAEHTFRWQCWDEQGSAVKVQRPGSQLHGWVRSGLGQDLLDDFITDNPVDDGSVQLTGPGVTSSPTFQVTPVGSTTPLPNGSIGTGFNWTSFLNNLTGQAAGVAKVAEISSATNTAALNASGMLSSLLPIIALVVVGGFAISALGSSRK